MLSQVVFQRGADYVCAVEAADVGRVRDNEQLGAWDSVCNSLRTGQGLGSVFLANDHQCGHCDLRQVLHDASSPEDAATELDNRFVVVVDNHLAESTELGPSGRVVTGLLREEQGHDVARERARPDYADHSHHQLVLESLQRRLDLGGSIHQRERAKKVRSAKSES